MIAVAKPRPYFHSQRAKEPDHYGLALFCARHFPLSPARAERAGLNASARPLVPLPHVRGAETVSLVRLRYWLPEGADASRSNARVTEPAAHAAADATANHVGLINPSLSIIRPDTWSGTWFIPQVKHRARQRRIAHAGRFRQIATGERLLDWRANRAFFKSQALTNRAIYFLISYYGNTRTTHENGNVDGDRFHCGPRRCNP